MRSIFLHLVLPLVFVPFAQAQLIEKGQKAPDFELTDQQGKTVSLSDFQGKVVLIDFWASWCVPCRMANKELPALYAKYKDYNFVILSISEDTNENSWKKAIAQDNLNWDSHVIDKTASVSKSYGVEGIPHAYLISEEGLVLNNQIDSDFLEDDLLWYFFEKPRLFPALTHHELRLSAEAKYVITNKAGDKVLKGKDQVVDISALPDGSYTVELNDKYNGDDLLYSFNKLSTKANVSFDYDRGKKQFVFPETVDYQVYNELGKLVLKGSGKSFSLIGVNDLRPEKTNTIVVNGHLSTFQL